MNVFSKAKSPHILFCCLSLSIHLCAMFAIGRYGHVYDFTRPIIPGQIISVALDEFASPETEQQTSTGGEESTTDSPFPSQQADAA